MPFRFGEADSSSGPLIPSTLQRSIIPQKGGSDNSMIFFQGSIKLVTSRNTDASPTNTTSSSEEVPFFCQAYSTCS